MYVLRQPGSFAAMDFSGGTFCRRGFAFVAIIALTLGACGQGPANQDPSHSSASGDEPGTYRQFVDTIVPLLESRCGVACHGVPADEYVAFMNDSANSRFFYFPVEPMTGKMPESPDMMRMVFEITRDTWRPQVVVGDEHDDDGGDQAEDVFAEAVRIDYQATPDFSPLLLAPLSESFGGSTHHGQDIFYDTNDSGYITMADWVGAEIALNPVALPKLSPAEEYFRDNVVGVLERNGCFVSSCHGSHVFNDLKLVRPLPRQQHVAGNQPLARLSPKMLAEERKVVLGKVARQINLGGDLKRSRLIAKNLPITEGGVHQRGGNTQFFKDIDDLDVQILLEWAQMEKDQLAAKLTSGGVSIPPADLGRIQGIAFLRGPRNSPRGFFEFDQFYPGTQLLVLPSGAKEPVAIYDEPGVEIQEFDVRYDARSIVFSMRRSADEGFRLFEIGLGDDLQPVDGSFRQLSFDPNRQADGTLIHHVDPVHIPQRAHEAEPGLDTALDKVAIAFASNAAGTFVASEPWGLLGEADKVGSTGSMIVDLQRVEEPGTFDGRRLYIVGGPLSGEWRTIKRHRAGGRLELDRPFDTVPDLRTVYVIEQTEPAYRSAFDIWRVQPGEWETTARRITWTNAQERRPSLRATGEVMFTSVRNRGYSDDKPVFNGAIYRVQASGWDYHIQGGNRSMYPLYTDSRELPSGLEIRLLLDPRNQWGGGELALADHGFGVNIEPDNPIDDLPFTHDQILYSGSQRFLPTQVPLFPETGPDAVTVTGLSPGGSFRDPYPEPNGSIFVAHTNQSINHLDPSANPDWDIYQITFADHQLQSLDGQRAGKVQLTRIDAASTSTMAEYAPQPIVVRLKEKSVTHQKFAARSDGLKPEEIDGVMRLPEGLPGELECYDFPLLQSFIENFIPLGYRNFREPELRYVRIIRQYPRSLDEIQSVPMTGPDADPFATSVSIGIHDRQEIVAEIPLETDGSFYAQIPSNVPLIVQGLNADRMAVISMNRWFYVQPGEKLTFSIPRSVYSTRCSGCHAALTGDRIDAIGPPDLVTAASLVMATWSKSTKVRRNPYRAEPFAVDFTQTIQPILDKRCVGCHGGGKPAGGLDLQGTPQGPWLTSYRSLHQLEDPASGNQANKRYINEREGLSSESYLIEKLMGKELRAPQALETPGVPHVPELTDEELLSLIRWIDLGATFRGGEA